VYPLSSSPLRCPQRISGFAPGRNALFTSPSDDLLNTPAPFSPFLARIAFWSSLFFFRPEPPVSLSLRREWFFPFPPPAESALHFHPTSDLLSVKFFPPPTAAPMHPPIHGLVPTTVSRFTYFFPNDEVSSRVVNLPPLSTRFIALHLIPHPGNCFRTFWNFLAL